MFSYNKLWHKLLDLKMKASDLEKQCSISRPTILKLKNNQPVDIKILDKICTFLDCNIEDIMEHIKE